MDKVLQPVFDKILSESKDLRQEGITQLADLLSKNNKVNYVGPNYSHFLPPELLSLKLGVSEQREIVVNLEKLIMINPNASSLFWVMGKAKPIVAIGPLLNLINMYSDELNDETAYQALIALENCLVDSDERELSTIIGQFRANPPDRFFQKIKFSSDVRLDDIATRILESTFE